MEAAGAIALAVGRLRRKIVQMPVEDGVPIPEVSALARLDRGGPQTSSDLAKAEGIRPQSMSATVAALEEKGFVRRSSDPGDGRRVVLRLTRQGRDVVAHKRAVRRRQLAEAMAGFSDRDVATLRRAAVLIERLVDEL